METTSTVEFLTSTYFASLLGFVASLCFTLQYIPQTVYNFRRKSVHGFSTTGIIIKYIGTSFLFINSILLGENMSVAMYGLCGVIQHSIFMIQFSLYASTTDTKIVSLELPSTTQPRKDKYLLWMLFPFVPFSLGLAYPESIYATSAVKPITQVLSHIPQMKVCYQLKTTAGISLASQHLNFIGGVLGLYMCWIIPPVSNMTYLIYVNSVLQAVTLYMMTIYYDGFYEGFLYGSFTSRPEKKGTE